LVDLGTRRDVKVAGLRILGVRTSQLKTRGDHREDRRDKIMVASSRHKSHRNRWSYERD
jgi:hypothetical protein